MRVVQQICVGLRQSLGLPHPQQGEPWIQLARRYGLLLQRIVVLKIASNRAAVLGCCIRAIIEPRLRTAPLRCPIVCALRWRFFLVIGCPRPTHRIRGAWGGGSDGTRTAPRRTRLTIASRMIAPMNATSSPPRLKLLLLMLCR